MKVLTSSLQHYVVQKGRMSNKEAIRKIISGEVLVNGIKANLKQALQPQDEVTLNGKVLKVPIAFTYIAFYKPRGVESTLHPLVERNLVDAVKIDQRVFPVGRLDKESEGLMLLTNDGNLYNHVSHAKNHQEKEYTVTVDKAVTPGVLARMATGVEIIGQKTRPAQVRQTGSHSFAIVLTQGLNRQIRRMCYKLGYHVERLVRVRMVHLGLGDLQPGEWRHLTADEVRGLLDSYEE